MSGLESVVRGVRGLVGLLFALLLLGVGCAQEMSETPTPALAPAPQPAGSTETPFVLPTLYPTQTRPLMQRTATTQPPATTTPGATADLEQKLVAFRYSIPALDLDRRLEGNVSGTVTVVDETTGLAAILRNRGGVLLELQQALPTLELAPLPEGCERCVHFSYALPLEGIEEEGWLQDPVMLASVDHYLSANLGPHFPAGTVVGLYRSASPYDVAATLALLEDGRLWRWLATSGEVAEPVNAASIGGDLRARMDEIPLDGLAEEYVVTCPGAPVEQLRLNPARNGAAAIEDETSEPATPAPSGDGIEVAIVCPAFSLPATLLPLYSRLDGLLADIGAEEGPAAPPPAIPLTTLLAYERVDGGRLLLLQNGEARGMTADGEVYTRTLGVSEVISLTVQLQENEALEPGVESYADGGAANSLLVRGSEGMAEAVWAEGEDPPEPLQMPVERLNLLLDQLIGIAAEGTSTPTATATPVATPTP